jgi:hypothetical protein
LIDPTHTAQNFVEGELSRKAWRGAFMGQLADHYARRPTQEFINTLPLVNGTDAAPSTIGASWERDSKNFGGPLNTWFAESSVNP